MFLARLRVVGAADALARVGTAKSTGSVYDADDELSAALDDYVARVDREHEQMIWTHPGMSTYYRNRHGRVFSAMPWRFVDYWAMTHDPDFSQYRLTPA